MGRRVARSSAALLVSVSLAGVSVAGGPSPAPWPAAEEVADRGFAVWPEDTVAEAQDACATRTAEEPWRLTPEGVVSEFAVRLMGHDDPQIDHEMSEVGDEEARIWLYPPRELATILNLRKAGDCWFVTYVQHRESASFGLDYTFDEEAVTAHLTSGWFAQLGFGDEVRQKAQDDGYVLRWRLEDESGESGHALVVGFRTGIGTIALADALPPPPEPRAGALVFPPSREPVWERIRAGRASRCRYQPEAGPTPERVVNELLMWEFSRAMPPGPYPDVLHTGRDGAIGTRVERYRKSDRRWLLVVDGVRYEVRLNHVMERCWAIQRLDALNRGPVLERVWVDGDQATVEVRDRWRRAGVSLLYGTEGIDVTARPRFGVAMSDADIGAEHANGFDSEDPGIVSAFVVVKGRYVDAQIRRLPPLT